MSDEEERYRTSSFARTDEEGEQEDYASSRHDSGGRDRRRREEEEEEGEGDEDEEDEGEEDEDDEDEGVSRSKRQKVRLFFMSGHSNTKSLPAPERALQHSKILPHS